MWLGFLKELFIYFFCLSECCFTKSLKESLQIPKLLKILLKNPLLGISLGSIDFSSRCWSRICKRSTELEMTKPPWALDWWLQPLTLSPELSSSPFWFKGLKVLTSEVLILLLKFALCHSPNIEKRFPSVAHEPAEDYLRACRPTPNRNQAVQILGEGMVGSSQRNCRQMWVLLSLLSNLLLGFAT